MLPAGLQGLGLVLDQDLVSQPAEVDPAVSSQVAEVDHHPDRQEELEDEGDQDCGHVARLLEKYL